MIRPARKPTPPLALAAYAALIFAGGGVLTACGHSAPTRFFTLDPVRPAAATSYAGPPLRVLAVHIPPTLDREELVSESPEGVMQVHDFERWEAPLGLTARQTVIQNLAARLPAGTVLGPSAPGAADVATLSADVVAFHVDPSGATLQAAWSVALPAGGASGAPLTWRAPMSQFHTPVEGSDGAATAHAFSAALAQLSDQIAADLPAQVARLDAQRREAEAAARAAESARTVTHATSTSVSRKPG